MSARRSTGTIFWGLTLVTIGGLLLAHNLGYTVHVWPYVVRYWPALLIAWGMLKFVDFFRFRSTGDSRPLFSGGEVFLLILVIFAGSALTMAANVSPELGNIFEIGNIDLWDITGDNYTYDQHREQLSVMPGAEVQILNLYGSVEVRPADTDRIVLDVTKTIRAPSRSEADRLNEEFSFSIAGDGTAYRIRSSRDESGFHPGQRQRFKSSLVVQVPKQAAIRVDNRNGRVLIQDLAGEQGIVNRYGDVEVRNVTGKVNIENRNGSVTVEDVTDSVAIANRYANTTVKDVGGDLRIETRNGSVDVSRVKGNASVENLYAPINIDDVQGSLTISGRNNSVDVRHIEGDIQSDSSFQNVTIQDPRGGVSVTSRNGDLLLSFERAPEKDISIDSRYANVTVEFPSSAAFRIDARTEYGNVDSEFEGLNVNRSGRERVINGEVRSGGPQVRVTTRNGDIRLHKRG